MKKEIYIAIAISITLHVALLLAFAYVHFQNATPFGDGMISVELIGSGALQNGVRQISGQSLAKKADMVGSEQSTSSAKAEGTSPGDGKEGGLPGIGAGSLTGDPLLAKIRTKIERSKYYPPDAKRQKLEGRPKVSFEINPDGSLRTATIKESSGIQALDEAALETLRRATPLPYFSSPITIAIKFALK